MKKILLIFGIFLCFNYANSQVKGLSSFDLENLIKGDAIEQLNSDQMSNAMAMPLGNVVDAYCYYVGPGDVLLIQNLSSLNQKDITVVSPENKVVIPRIGEVDLKGKTLAEARELILAKIQGNTKDALAFVSLYKPRNVIIEVTGNVTNPGTYTYPASFKISTVIKFANQIKPTATTTLQQGTLINQKTEKKKQFDELFSNSGISYLSSFKTRNILVINSDGSSSVADLDKAAVHNDAKFDPYIREGVQIYIPYDNKEVPKISISGSVIRPYVTSFKKGDFASMLLKLGGGLLEEADLDNVQLILPDDSKTIALKIDNKLNLQQDDIELQPGSMIIIGQKNDVRKSIQGVVSVIGNVNKPGVYQIINDKTTIKEIIDNCGGFTSEAYLPLATIVRRDKSITDTKSINYLLMEKFKNSNLTIYDTTRYQIDIMMREPRVSCDFEAIFIKGNQNSNITLKDGDIIRIPSNPRTVFVFGQVKNPGYITFLEGKNMKWYIEQAGGFSENSKKKAARIIRGNNNTWVEGNDDVLVYAGDEIYVPSPPNIPAEAEAQTWIMLSTIASTVFGLFNVIYWWTR